MPLAPTQDGLHAPAGAPVLGPGLVPRYHAPGAHGWPKPRNNAMRVGATIVGFIAAASVLIARAASPEKQLAQPFDTQTRVPWATSHVAGTPDPPLPYRLRRVFEKLPLTQPLFLTHDPTTKQLLVIEQPGHVLAFANLADVERSDVFLDVGEETYSLAFDPRYAENHFVYAFSNGPRDAKVKRNRIARYEASGDAPRHCDPATQRVIIEWESNGHNGGDLAFGPDGFLYISSGDGTSDSDTNLTGQDVSDLPSGILRIDVHAGDADRNYAIPPDNPFVNTAGARGELWAYGLRNPWRISFDHDTGRLWVGDVGQDWRELIDVITRGGNYGWSITEGDLPFQPLRKRGPTPIVPPVVAHPHSEARSITGGHVYYGQRFPDLRGAYVYGDYATGRVWGIRYDGQRITWHRELADTALQIASFGADADGELLIVDYVGGIYEFAATEPTANARAFPRRLSETGLFVSVADHLPAAGVIPYSVNSTLWSDGATKERFIALPEKGQIQFTEARGWNFSDGAVAVKTFSLELQPGDPQSRRRLETRLLVREQGEWSGYSYEWNDAQTDAELVPATGRDRVLAITDQGASKPREQTWHFPSRAECMVCHTRAANYVLGLSMPQMNRVHRYGEVEENQLVVLERLGVFRDPLPRRPAEMAALADPLDTSATIDARARSYLHANCAHCHVSAGGGNARLELEFTTPLDKMNLVNEPALHDKFGIADSLLLVPGTPERSLVLNRMARTGRGRMPPLSSSVVDTTAVRLLEEWIVGLATPAAK
jgi:uncharacterized repeat protein (TIGR03806 family)